MKLLSSPKPQIASPTVDELFDRREMEQHPESPRALSEENRVIESQLIK